MKIDKKTIKNILVVRNDRFGEFLLNIPALRALKDTFINTRLIAIVDPYVKELAESVPFIDEVIEWGRVKHSLYEKFHLINLLKKKNIDIAVILNPSKEFNIFTYLAGIPVRVGYNRKWGLLLSHKIKDLKHQAIKHEVEYNFDLLKAIGIDSDKKSPQININRQEEQQALVVLANYGINKETSFIVVHPWTSDPVKQWPMKYFIELVKRISGELGMMRVLIIGGKEELRKSKEYFSNLGDNVINLTGATSLKESAVILKYAKLLVSGDSGPVHLASSVGIPVVAIFRNDIPGKSATRWGPKSKGSIVIEKNNLEDITVAEVLDKVRSAIK